MNDLLAATLFRKFHAFQGGREEEAEAQPPQCHHYSMTVIEQIRTVVIYN